MRKPGTHERFIIYRSGKTVAEGIEFSDGIVVIHWCEDDKPRTVIAYTTVVEAEEQLAADGETQFNWDF